MRDQIEDAMATQAVTLELPEHLYRELQRRAAQSGQSIEAELLATVVQSLDASIAEFDDLAALQDSLALLDDDGLRCAARSHLPKDAAAELETLHLKQQREGLTASEKKTEAALLRRYERAMLIRAHALAFLKLRGHVVEEYLIRPGIPMDEEELSDVEAARIVAEGRRRG